MKTDYSCKVCGTLFTRLVLSDGKKGSTKYCSETCRAVAPKTGVETYTCLQCEKPFQARKADRNRGFARYCSIPCVNLAAKANPRNQFSEKKAAEFKTDNLKGIWS